MMARAAWPGGEPRSDTLLTCMGVEGSLLAAAAPAPAAAALPLLLSSSAKCLVTSERYLGCSVPHQRSQCVLLGARQEGRDRECRKRRDPT